MSEQFVYLMVCRAASDPLKPGSARGYYCETCKREITVSAQGRQRLAHSPGQVKTLCNDCGFNQLLELIGAGRR